MWWLLVVKQSLRCPNVVWSLISLVFWVFFAIFVNYDFQHSQSSRKQCKDTANATPEGCLNTNSLFVSILYILLFTMIIFLSMCGTRLPSNHLLNGFTSWLWKPVSLPGTNWSSVKKKKKKKKKSETSLLFPKLWNALFVSSCWYDDDDTVQTTTLTDMC